MKKILVACGTGMATSTMISEKIRNIMEEAGIDCTITQCILSEIRSNAANVDVVVTSMKIDEEYGIPVLLGTAFLTGMNEEETKNKLLEILSE